MDIQSLFVDLVDKAKGISGSLARSEIKGKHPVRVRFYTLLMDYLNGPGSPAAGDFFMWYIERLDERKRMSPQWMQAIYKVTKKENESGFRNFLIDCHNRFQSNPDFTEAIKPWIPDDEFRILSSSTSSDITGVIKIAIQICQEKDEVEKQIKGAIFAALPTFMIGLLMHYVIFNFVYSSAVTPGFMDVKTWSELTLVEKNYAAYSWIMENWLLCGVGLIGVFMFFKWSVKNWHNRLVFIREHYFDYLPPYSLAKTNEQYNTLLILSSFMRSGKSFNESLLEVSDGACKYVKMQVAKILNNDTEQASVALNIFYLGTFGSDIRDRSKYMPLENAIETLLPRMQKEKNEKFQRIVNLSMLLTLKPLIIGSLVFSIVPVLMSLMSNLPDV